MYELALFAGGGGGLLGSKLLGWKTVCYVENNKYCCEIIKARIKDGLLEDAPIWDNVATFDGHAWAGAVDIVSAGFPCQPFSTAGHMRAGRDERNLWPETIRVIEEVRPGWCLLENVPGLLAGRHGYFAQILLDLARRGFTARWGCLPAAAVG
ncbi:MAG: DNA cytosine methyltransferase, partial [Pseudomonadota bacterium]